jgi:hypothetical protein
MRRLLAELLYPEAFKDQRAYEHLLIRARDAFWWLGKFPEACATLRWLIDNDHDWRRPIGEPGVCIWWQTIDEFREKLRRGEHIEAAELGRWQRKDSPQ